MQEVMAKHLVEDGKFSVLGRHVGVIDSAVASGTLQEATLSRLPQNLDSQEAASNIPLSLLPPQHRTHAQHTDVHVQAHRNVNCQDKGCTDIDCRLQRLGLSEGENWKDATPF